MQESLLMMDKEEREPDAPENRPARAGRGMLWEIGGALLGLLTLFLAISLVLGEESNALIGNVGSVTARVLHFFLGQIAAFFVPVFLAWAAIQVFRGRIRPWSPARILGIALLLIGLTGLIALPSADVPEAKEAAFARAGAVGTFLVNWEGLRLVGTFGSIGAAMILLFAIVVGIMMITHLRLSQLALWTYGVVTRNPQDLRVRDSGEAIATPAAATSITARPVARAATPAPSGAAVAEPQPAPSSESNGLFGLFRRTPREPFLAEPDPEEQEDVEDHAPMYDEDALAAARALEEARIDEEYERALREEQERLARGDNDEDDEEIVFHDMTASTQLDVVSGNPANNFEDTRLADGLAKLFPQRWEKDGGGSVRRSGTDAEVDEIDEEDEESVEQEAERERVRGAAEDRAFRRALKDGAVNTDDVEDVDIEDGNDEDDPLFSDDLDTRPAGVQAALQAAAKSALEHDAEIARRSRMMAEYRLPDVQVLEDPPRVDNRVSREEMLETSQTLEKTFADFNIAVKVVEIKQGPVVTRFELKPAPGIKVSRIVSLEHDIALAMKAPSVRIVAPIPGKAAVGIEIPNRNRAGVYLKELVACGEFWEHPSPLGFALGKTIEGTPYFADLKKMPHLLIAGATGAGKSVCLNTIICSFLYRMRPDRLRLLLVDPKRVELSIYQGIPHLISPVVCEAKRAAAALSWAVEQMESRYKQLVEFGVRNIDGYNDIVLNPEKHARHRGKRLEYMPHMVVIVDELADLMVVAKNEVEESIQRLAQMSRAVGIHLILATQRPSVNVITGIIKANFPTRIAFQVSQKVDSRTILDGNGAEALLGRGDMLFAPAGAQKPLRIQGAFLSDEEVERIADHCRTQAEPMYEVEEFEPLLSEKEQREMARLMGVEDMDDLDMQERMTRGTNRTMGKVSAGMFIPHEGGSAQAGDDEIDEALVRAAARVILEGRKGSTSLVQRRLKVGFARAGRLMDMLEEMGIVGPYKGSKPRDILVDCDAAIAQLEALEEQIAQTGDSKAAAQALDGRG